MSFVSKFELTSYLYAFNAKFPPEMMICHLSFILYIFLQTKEEWNEIS
jgi:hypothetical protein